MSPKAAWYTKLLIWVLASIAIGVDIWLAVNSVKGDTISEVSQAYAWKWATIPVSYGVITGHLFWPLFGEIRWKWPRMIALWVLAVALVILDAVDFYDVVPIIPLVPAVVLGRLLWPQSVSAKQALFVWKK
jgi:hypothetical protein